MSNSHLLSGPEVTVLLAALGLILNASIAFLMAFKKPSKRFPGGAVRMRRPAAVPLRRTE